MATKLSGKRYAQAVLEIARQENRFEEWRSSLKRISEFLQKPELAAYFESSRIPQEAKKQAAAELFQGLFPEALNLAYLLILKNKIRIAPVVLSEYERLLDTHYGIEHATIVTAIPLDEAGEEMTIRYLERLTGHKIKAELKVDPGIIGGIVIRVDDRLMDGSVKKTLEVLQKTMVEARK